MDKRNPINKSYNVIFKTLYERFKSSFSEDAVEAFWDENSKRYIHPGEFGRYREKIASEFLSILLPNRIGIGTGFIISPYLEQPSTQADIVLYDKINGTMLESDQMQTFFPCESTLGIVEIKSDLTETMFVEAIRKLTEFRKYRMMYMNSIYSFSNVPHPIAKVNLQIFPAIPNPAYLVNKNEWKNKILPCRTEELPLPIYEAHNIPTVLICNRFKDFFPNENTWRKCYHDTHYSDRVNIIYSLEDGLFVYGLPVQGQEEAVGYPFPSSTEFGSLQSCFDKKGNKLQQAKSFAHNFNACITSITTIRTELAAYLEGEPNQLEIDRHRHINK